MISGIATRAFLVSLVAQSTILASPTAISFGNTHGQVALDTADTFSGFGSTNVTSLSKRWDGSPAMGRELDGAKGKACSLWPMMHYDDAKAGQMFSPPRTLAQSDYLQLQGMTVKQDRSAQ
jgi:hypothetical protein